LGEAKVKVFVAAVMALVSAGALASTPEEIMKSCLDENQRSNRQYDCAKDGAYLKAARAAALKISDFSIGQKLDACPEGSRKSQSGHRVHCSLGPVTFADVNAFEYSLTLFNGEVIGALLRLSDRGHRALEKILAELTARFGNPDPSLSKPDLHSYFWVRGSIVTFFDGAAGSVLLTDVVKTEVAKLRAAPSNQVDF
jgi:hypothetical protein